MKILVVGHSYVVDANRQFWNQVAETEKVEIDLIAPKSWKSNLIKTINLIQNQFTDKFINKIFAIPVYQSGNGSFYHYYWLELFKVLNKEKYDSIFIFQETWAFSLAQVVFLKLITKNCKTPIHLAVCQNIIKPQLAWLIPWEKLLCSFVNRIWFCTYEIKDVLAYKGIKNKTEYLPFTFDQDIYQAKLKEIHGKVKLGYIGRFTEEKGLLDLVQACKELIATGWEIELHLAGGGSLDHQLTDSFIVKHGIIPHVDAYKFYHQIHILVLPSITKRFWKEQFGRVLVESTASGTPVIGSSSGAIPEVISNIGFGKVFKEGDVSSLKKQIESLVIDMKQDNYPTQMQSAIVRTIDFSSHRAVGRKLINQMIIDSN